MSVRDYQWTDRETVQAIYQRAFSGPPWHQQITWDQAEECWHACTLRRGFGCLVAEAEQQVAGFTCWDTPTMPELHKERGQELADFVKRLGPDWIVWIRETAVDPDYYNQGIATLLERALLNCITGRADRTAVLVRRRDDNIPIVRLSVTLGLQRTGIKVPSLKQPEIFHEYWYKVLCEGER